MCGITGVLGPGGAKVIEAMTEALYHRGPDGTGTWKGGGVALGARRLAIVDVAGGHQPMVSGDHVLVANGEIYNHVELRRELEAHGDRFTTQCDVEVLLHGIRRFGKDFLQRIRGFFALALWDAKQRRLFLARDRFGIAPLVWTRVGEAFAFASEVKAFEELPGWNGRLNKAALNDYLKHRYALGPRTFFADVEHLPHGTWMTVEPGGRTQAGTWYELPGLASDDVKPAEALERLREALTRAVSRRRQGEVPIGLYLSGGLDSALIAAISADQGEGLPAYSHGFDPAQDEISAAEAVAKHTGTKLFRAQLGADQLEALPAIVRAMEQPVANSDVIGLWALAERASQDVKAVLCGEGADELFGSYPHQQLLASLSACPTFAVRAAGQLVGSTPNWVLNRFSRYRGAGSDVRVRQRLRAALKQKTLAERYRGLVSLFSEEERLTLLQPSAHMERVQERWQLTEALNDAGAPPLERLIRMKFAGWLPDYHLGRENRIAMAHGIEARYPYLDTDVVEAVVPLGIKHKMGWIPPREKRLLRQIASDLLPRAIAQRPKGPVRVPVTCFGPRFHEMAGDVLNTKALAAGGIFAGQAVQELLQAAREGSFLAGRQVFALLMFEVWRREWKVTCS